MFAQEAEEQVGWELVQWEEEKSRVLEAFSHVATRGAVPPLLSPPNASHSLCSGRSAPHNAAASGDFLIDNISDQRAWWYTYIQFYSSVQSINQSMFITQTTTHRIFQASKAF